MSDRTPATAGARRIRLLLLLLLATTLLLIAGLLGIFLSLEYRRAIARAEATTRDLTLVLEQFAIRTFENGDQVAARIADEILAAGGVSGIRPPVLHQLLARLSANMAGDYLMVVDRTGMPVSISDRRDVPATSLADRAWFQAHLHGAEQHVGEALFSRITGEVLYTYSRRLIAPDGRFDGAVQVSFRQRFFSTAGIGLNQGRDTVFSLLGPAGGIIARSNLAPPDVDRTMAASPIFSAYATQSTGTFRAASIFDGREEITSFRRLERWPVVAVTSLPVTTALASWYGSLWWSGAIALPAFGSLVPLVFLLLRASATEARTRDALNRALADKEVLFREVHHRVKNNLQVTSSLVQLQSAKFSDPAVRAAFEETAERLRAIGLVHETLYGSNQAAEVDLPSYLTRLAQGLADTYAAGERGIKLQFRLNPSSIDLERAVPVALIVTEVLSNAMKHAFRPGDGGSVTIAVSQDRTGHRVEICDDGRGMPADTQRDGSIGMKLIQALTRQLYADSGFTPPPAGHGTCFHMQIPPLSPLPPGA
ncbi:sensor histidine kinase [Oleisolibacter albus]|uniref:sensor histidine kinase n=1 Tax=Oleisolibacter albus TaxID=2171757 RepID=UPI0013903D23|nr:histidine kinase dimerization/phosphoacceptor domain -containing protein [Oleisolibacter albus]